MYNDLINDQKVNEPKTKRYIRRITPKLGYNDVCRGHYFKHIINLLLNEYNIPIEDIAEEIGIDSSKIQTVLTKIEDMEELDIMESIFDFLSRETDWQDNVKSLVTVRRKIVELSEIHTKFLLDRLYSTVERIGTDD